MDFRDPRYRALFVLVPLVVFLWAAHVAWTVLLGTGLQTETYVHGVLIVGGSALLGYCVVWAAAFLGNLRNNLKTGFEAEVIDEFGTGFEMGGAAFKMSLSKFLPQMVAPPNWPGLHPLEAELLGFLQGYRHWPVNLDSQNVQQEASPGKEFVSLYEQAVARWQIMRHLPGAGPWHRVAALSKDLALVHAYREIRTTYPLKHFWKRDKVKFVARSQAHGGITAFVLSTFPAFRALKGTPEGDDIQRALLVGLRYHATPTLLPLNSGGLARELVDYLWRAEAQLQNMDVREMDQATPEQIDDLRQDVETQWLTLLGDLTPSDHLDDASTCLKLDDGSVWLTQETLLTQLAPLMRPSVRQAFGLWDTSSKLQHPSWPHLSNLLLELGFIANEHDGQSASNGCFSFSVGPLTWGPAVKFELDASKHVSVMRSWAQLPALPHTPEIAMDSRQLAAQFQALSGDVDARLAELF